MAIVPSGKTRVMVAQTYHDTLSEGNGMEYDTSRSFSTDDAMEEEVGVTNVEPGLGGETSIEGGVDPEENPQEGIEDTHEKTLTNYVFRILKNYGYPGRRLNEFKSKFVKEVVSPEGVEDIQIEIPDKKYPNEQGVSGAIEKKELKRIVQEINSAFGLHFNGAERSEGKWTIKFTSQKSENPDDQGIVGDTLNEVYGTPNRNKSQDKQQQPIGRAANSEEDLIKRATLGEMIKDEKNKYISGLQKIIGE